MTRLAPLALLGACATGEADDVCAAERIPDPVDTTGWATGALVPAGDEVVHVLARWPNSGSAEPWPVAVVVHGAWSLVGTELDEDALTVGVADGLVAVHLDLPGANGSTGADDRHGPIAREAVAAALRWAGGEARDLGGCTLHDRVPDAAGGSLVLVGASNGGNLAMATLADPAVDTPDVAGLALWEVPSSAPFVGVEFGVDPTVYVPGSCALDDAEGVACPFPDERLLAGRIDGAAVLCFDESGDGGCGDGDVVIRGVRDKRDRTLVSPGLARAAEARGVLPDGFATADEAESWWSERDATRLAGPLVALRPELPVLLLATEQDHVQTLADHPHVFGLLEALQGADAAWVRLNPGLDWLPEAGAENPPNAAYALDAPDGALLPEAAEQPPERMFAAAVRELAERTAAGYW